MGYCLPLLHLHHQHVIICPVVNVRTLTLHIRDSKLNANSCVTLSNLMTRLSTEEHNICRTYYDQADPTEIERFEAPQYSRFANTTVHGIYATVPGNSSTEILCCTCHLHSHLHSTHSGYRKIHPSSISKFKPTQGAFAFTNFTRLFKCRIHF